MNCLEWLHSGPVFFCSAIISSFPSPLPFHSLLTVRRNSQKKIKEPKLLELFVFEMQPLSLSKASGQRQEQLAGLERRLAFQGTGGAPGGLLERKQSRTQKSRPDDLHNGSDVV